MLNPFPSTFWSNTTARDLIIGTAGILLLMLFVVSLAVQPSFLPEIVNEVETTDGQLVLLRTYFHK